MAPSSWSSGKGMMRFFSFTLVQLLLFQQQICVIEATSSCVAVHPSVTTASLPVFDGVRVRGGSQQKTPPRRKNAHFAPSPKISNKAAVSSSSSSTGNMASVSKGPLGSFISWSGQNKLALSLTAIVLAVAYRERQAWVPLVTDRERLQQETLRLLHKYLEPKDGAAVWKSLVMYATAMAVWEFCGLSTIPIETAAAMVFGWSALVASAAGKLTGASASFLVGRTLFQKWVKRHPSVQDNVVLQILQEDHQYKNKNISGYHSPLQTALFMKFSLFPELIKNMGSGAIISDEKLNFWAFLAATAFHGVGFTALWTWVGVESARQLVVPAATSSTTDAAMTATSSSGVGMHVALLVAGAMGLILSPALMAWWIRDLRRMQKEQGQRNKRR